MKILFIALTIIFAVFYFTFSSIKSEQDAKHLETGIAYLEQNKQAQGVVTLDNGLQYKILVEGNGVKPQADDTVVVHYRGKTLDGKEFDSSYKRGEPARFKANRLIEGWTQALQLMPTGSKWELTIPHELAYGERGAGTAIPPYAVLIFELELIDVPQ